MKLLKFFSIFLLMFSLVFSLSCNEDKESEITTNIPMTMKEGETLIVSVVVDGIRLSNGQYEVFFDTEDLEFNGGVITALNAGTSGVQVLYNGKLVYNGTIEVISSTINVTYNLNGGTALGDLDTVVKYGEEVVLPEAEKENYVFCGWRDENNKLYLKVDSSIGKDITLTVLWHELDDDGFTILEISDKIRRLKSEYYLDDEEKLEDLSAMIDSTSEELLNYVFNISKYNDIIANLTEQKNQINEINQLILTINYSSNKQLLIEKILELYNLIPDENLSYINNYQKFTESLLEVNNMLIDLGDYIPEVLTEVTTLPEQIDGLDVEWSTDNDDLVVIENNTATLNKAYLSSKKQNAAITANFEFLGVDISITKECEVQAIEYEELPTSPVCAYINIGALSHYDDCNGRKELFSQDVKDALDIVYVSFVNPTSSGSLNVGQTFKNYLPQILDLKNSGIRVFVCVGGGGTSRAFSDTAADNTKLDTFTTQLVELVFEYGFAGVDIDWEYPGYDTDRESSVDSANYVKMFAMLRNKLNAYGVDNGSKILLSSAIPGSPWSFSRFDAPGLNQYLDYVNIMSYDLNNPNKATHLSPLYTSGNDGGYGFSADTAVSLFVNAGFDKEKLIIGCATYGKAYQLSGAVTGSNCLGKAGTLIKVSGVNGSYDSGTIYYYAIKQLLQDPEYKIYYDYAADGKIASSYIFNETNKIFITYEDSTTYYLKYQYALANNLGIMIWSLPEDATDTFITEVLKIKNK